MEDFEETFSLAPDKLTDQREQVSLFGASNYDDDQEDRETLISRPTPIDIFRNTPKLIIQTRTPIARRSFFLRSAGMIAQRNEDRITTRHNQTFYLDRDAFRLQLDN